MLSLLLLKVIGMTQRPIPYLVPSDHCTINYNSVDIVDEIAFY
jgi:hypothetical protein